MTVIDCITSPPVDAMRAAGVTGVCRYLSWADERDTLRKVIHQPEFNQLHAARFDILLNWEYAAEDWLGGASSGQAHAAEAVRQARALGYPTGCAIPGSADFDMTSAQWNSSGASYARAYSAGIRAGGYVAGVYGPWDVLIWCQQLGGFGMYWQSLSTGWSGGRNGKLWPGTHLWQRRGGTVGGVDVDFNDAIVANYGQFFGGTVVLGQDDINAIAAAVKAAVGGGPFSLTIDQLSGWLANGLDPRNNPPAPTGQPSLREVLDKLATVGAPSQEQVDAAMAKVLTPDLLRQALDGLGFTGTLQV